MKNLTLRNITKAVGGTYHGDECLLDREVSSVVTDSREVEKDGLFIPIVGERVDGHKFIPDVFAAGASAVLAEHELENALGPYIQVTSSPKALMDIAEFYRAGLTIPIIGITGSVGKTSTKEMIASVLSQKFNVLKTAGNFNNEIGMPLTILKIRDEHEAAVIEMGISHFGEMHRMAKAARPDICVMTNIGECHLEFLGDRDGVLRAKSEIFDFLKPDGAVVLNGCDDKLCTIEQPGGVQPMRYFVADGSAEMTFPADSYAVRAEHIVSRGLEGLDADFVFEGKTVRRIHEPLPGIHNIYNACAAACVGRHLGMTPEEIAGGIARAQTIGGRFNMIHLSDNIMVIDDCYNANPVSMEASLQVLSSAEGRKIAVLGDMGELGSDEKTLHARVGAAAAACGIDALFCAGTLSREMAAAADGIAFVRHFDDKKELIHTLLDYVCPGDSILVKASHFMGFSEIVEALKDKYRPQS